MRRSSRSTHALAAGACGLALLAALAGCGSSGSTTSATSGAQSAGTQSAGASSDQAQSLQRALADFTDTGAAPGIIAVVQNGDERSVVTEGVGDIPAATPMTDTAATRIASVSKAFSGAVVLRLVSSGDLALDDTVGELLPSMPKDWGPVTVAQLLQHTSGLPDYIKSPAFLDDFLADPSAGMTPKQLIGYVADEPLEFPPGSTYGYSDTDNIVLGLIAEKATGEPYATALRTGVVDPLGLAGTTLPDTTELPAGYIHGYAAPDSEAGASAAPEDVSMLINPTLAWASGGMVSTAADLNTFIRSYASGQGIEPSVYAQQQTWVPGGGGPPGPGTNSSGLGIYRYETGCGTFYGHTGNMPGYTIFVASTPDGRSSAVVVTNGQVNPKADAATFEALLAAEDAALCLATGQAGPTSSG